MKIQKGESYLCKDGTVFTVSNVSEYSVFYEYTDEDGVNVWSMLLETFYLFISQGKLKKI